MLFEDGSSTHDLAFERGLVVAGVGLVVAASSESSGRASASGRMSPTTGVAFLRD